jgi:antirestriction protein ArdC
MGSTSYAREELVAELGAFLVCRRLEVDSSPENHAAYLSGWISILKESPKVLLKVLSDARKAADLITAEG